ncbi:hypothetical protein BDB00DRAFT_861229, partial [Zychaea mexicana]|uniref:uncharacterized protein n=1 Tax=Zychaea mexicana TaxID=64656 RepID=UPI0022FE9B78
MGRESKLLSNEVFLFCSSLLYYFSLPSAFARVTLFVTSIIAYFILTTKIAKCNLLPLGSWVLRIQNRFGSGSVL